MKRPAVILLVIAVLLAPVYAHADREPAVWKSGDPDASKIAITVDDCYRKHHVEAILDLCDRYGIKVTFFPVGATIFEEEGELWRRIAESGHEIGNHSYDHINMAKNMPNRKCREQFVKMEKALDRALGYHYEVRAYRPPYGSYGLIANWRRYASHGYPDIILWSLHSTDFEKCAAKVENGSILLFHSQQEDVECLERLIPAVLDMGLEPVTISELLGLEPFVKEREEKELVSFES